VKPRIYPATDNGRPDGNPVFLSPAMWEKKKRSSRRRSRRRCSRTRSRAPSRCSAPEWFRPYTARPKTLTVYIMVDPSKGKSARSDRTAIAVIGLDYDGNKYLLDGYRHRMSLSERYDAVTRLYKHWTVQPGVQLVSVGWERYGMQTDDEYVKERQMREGFGFPLTELSWTREGNESKRNRVERLEPDIRLSRLFLPALVWQPGSPENLWSINTEKAQVESRKLIAPTRQMDVLERAGDKHLIARPIVRRDEEGKLYDLTTAFQEEATFFPYGTHDDLIDAVSRIYDMQAVPPVNNESAASIEALEPEYPDA
jgi:hypothetical protein